MIISGRAAAENEKINIMVIDDDDTVRDVVCEILRRKGWNVSEFNNAETAFAALKRDKFDLVLSDIGMSGMGGMEFLHLTREVAPEVPVVMITGYPSMDLAVEAMKIGAADFLAKPFKTEELEMAVRKAVIESAKDKEIKLSQASKGPRHENTRHRLEDKIKELSIMHTISEMLDEVNEKEEIFSKTMALAQIIADADKAFIMVVDENNRDLVIHAVSGYDEKTLIGKRFPLREEPFKEVVENRCPAYYQIDDRAGKLAVLANNLGWSKNCSPLFLSPMMINKEVVVIMGLAGKTTLKSLTSDAQALLMNLTAKSSLKLENIALSENIFSSIIGAINSLINALDARDTYTKDHSNRVTQYASKIAKAMGCNQEILDSISFAGPLHDIGKIAIRDEVLLKKGYFTNDEREIIKSHVVRGEEILRPLNLLSIEKAVVLYHHERWDGLGYPNNLAGEDIPIVARIFSVADTFDAMTSTRPYRNALSLEVARDEILRCRGTQFDPRAVDAFMESGILSANA